VRKGRFKREAVTERWRLFCVIPKEYRPQNVRDLVRRNIKRKEKKHRKGSESTENLRQMKEKESFSSFKKSLF
jgi:hypothetical protein